MTDRDSASGAPCQLRAPFTQLVKPPTNAALVLVSATVFALMFTLVLLCAVVSTLSALIVAPFREHNREQRG